MSTRPLLLIAPLAALLLAPFTVAATPAGEACADEGLPVVTEEGLAEAFAPPTDGGTTYHEFVLDLSESGAEKATVTAEMTWTVAVNDYDLALNGLTSEGYQPFDPAVESSTTSIEHCEVFELALIDYLAPAPVEDLQVTVTVG